MADDSQKMPDQEELERELSDYLSKKYGYKIKVISPMMLPQGRATQDDKKGPSGIDRIRFDMKPEELEAYLNQFVIKQEQAKAILATKICTHYNRIKRQNRRSGGGKAHTVGRIKNNMLLLGPTGVGKTYLIKLIAQKIGVPFVKGDATKFSETGYVGGDVEDLVRELVIEADEDIELAQYGIIYIDEIDKIAASAHFLGPDVSRAGVQRALLKPMEETEVDLKVPHDPISQLQALESYRKTGKREKRTVNTRNILFIMSGAFNGLAPIVKKRLQNQEIGFGAQIQSKGDEIRFNNLAKAEDLIAFGFESEFIGRIPVLAVLEPLEVEDLHEILRNPNNPIILGKKEDFRSYGIDIQFDDQALRLLAEMASAEKTGARGLVSVIERVLLPYEKKLPSTGISFVVITPEVVRNPMGELERLLSEPESPDRIAAYQDIVKQEKSRLYEQIIQKSHYIGSYPLVFTPDRVDMALDHHIRTDQSIETIFDDIILLYNQIRVFQDDFLEKHGLKIQYDDEAINEIMRRALQRDLTAVALCKEISADYDYGFKLIHERSGQKQFLLPKNAVLHPDVYLDELIREHYRDFPFGTSESDARKDT
jgi:endopeptidase Clp ATP-binding regulatory subunit ClpX